jgi:hypothetical protein
MSTSLAEKLGLPQPFTACPTRPPTHSIEVRNEDGLLGILTFAAPYAAKMFLDELIGDHDFTWKKDDMIQLTTDELAMRIQGDVEELMEYKLSKKEQQWELPHNYKIQAELWRSGTNVYAGRELEPQPDPQPKPKREPKPRKERKPKAPAPDGAITVAAIADKIGMKASDARAILRKRKVPKPDHGWSGDSKWAKEIEKHLKEGAK